MKAQFLLIPAAAIVCVATPAYAKVYLSLEQAQQLMFPGATFAQQTLTLTDDQARAIEKASGTDVRNRQVQLWKVSTGGWFIADQVVGKHDFIPIAVGLDDSGAVKSIEILEYREAFGEQVRNPQWLAQFQGKRNGATLTLTKDIQNISGATLSSKHITDGVRRLLATYAIAIASH
ncbi:FMN-binding protein [Dyella choica]|uniref:FMN-binding protein n=1 Tax=Dyella choica TaxID=1927959 RepID=A0A432M8B4_9GAMM|nr:FMN-binding protein [Dyella choica]RUL78138.1 FMN-binding protein [Dyella choica]